MSDPYKAPPAEIDNKISGLSDVPGAGDHFFVMKDIEEARETAESRMQEGRRESLSQRVAPMTLEPASRPPFEFCAA